MQCSIKWAPKSLSLTITNFRDESLKYFAPWPVARKVVFVANDFSVSATLIYPNLMYICITC